MLHKTILLIPGVSRMRVTREPDRVEIHCQTCQATETHAYIHDRPATVDTFGHKEGCGLGAEVQREMARRQRPGVIPR